MKRSVGSNLLLAERIIRRRSKARLSLEDASRHKTIVDCIRHFLSSGNVANSDVGISSDVLAKHPDAKGANESNQDYVDFVRQILVHDFGWKNTTIDGRAHVLPPVNWNVNAMQPPPISDSRRQDLVDEMFNSSGARLSHEQPWVQKNDRQTAEALIRKATSTIPRLKQGTLKMHLQDSVRCIAHYLNEGMIIPKQLCEKLDALLKSTDAIVSHNQQSGYSNQY